MRTYHDVATPQKAMLPLTTVICTGAVLTGIYPAQSIFPQRDSIAASRMEEKFQGCQDSAGRPIDRFYYNKGL
jgi:hypothetical protein